MSVFRPSLIAPKQLGGWPFEDFGRVAGRWPPTRRRAGARSESPQRGRRGVVAAAGRPPPLSLYSQFRQRLVHSDPGFTLRAYIHLLDDSHERARLAVGAAASAWELPEDGLETA